MKNHHVETECIPRERFSPLGATRLKRLGLTATPRADLTIVEELRRSREQPAERAWVTC
jgi:hypothetical protein